MSQPRVPSPEDEHPYREFADAFLDISGFKRFVKTWLEILRAPTDNTFAAFERFSVQDAVRFFQYAIGVFIVLTAAGRVLQGLGDLVAGFVNSLLIVGGYLIVLRLYYRLASRRFGELSQSHSAYVRMYCIFAGFTLPFFTVAMWLMQRGDGDAWLCVSVVAAVAASAVTLGYGLLIWGRFWNAPANQALALLMVAGLVGFLAVWVAYLLLAIIYGILTNTDLR
jgi:hypothetical protein